MKKLLSILITLALVCSLSLPALAAPQTIDIETMSATELTALKTSIDAQLAKLNSSSDEGYTVVNTKNYSSYAKTPDSHKEELIQFNGEIVQVIEDDSKYSYRVAVDSNSDNIMYVTADAPSDGSHFTEDERVSIKGTFGGLYSYESTFSAQVTVPSCAADSMVDYAASFAQYPHTNPAKVGVETIFPGDKYGNTATTSITVTNVIRGDAATAIAKSYSRYNRPDKGYEFILVCLHVACISAPEEKAEISNYNFTFVSSTGKELDKESIYQYNDELADIYEGYTQDAYIMCQVSPDDKPLLVYNQDSDYAIWFDLNQREVAKADASTLTELNSKSTGEAVTKLQLMLAEMGYYVAAPTGTYDNATKKAVQKYQKAAGIKATGTADVDTLAAIMSGKKP